jgi:hypothetical protein
MLGEENRAGFLLRMIESGRVWRSERAKTDDEIAVKPEMVVRVTERWGK